MLVRAQAAGLGFRRRHGVGAQEHGRQHVVRAVLGVREPGRERLSVYALQAREVARGGRGVVVWRFWPVRDFDLGKQPVEHLEHVLELKRRVRERRPVTVRNLLPGHARLGPPGPRPQRRHLFFSGALCYTHAVKQVRNHLHWLRSHQVVALEVPARARARHAGRRRV